MCVYFEMLHIHAGISIFSEVISNTLEPLGTILGLAYNQSSIQLDFLNA